MKRLKILVLFDTAGTPPADQDFSREFATEDWQTESEVVSALKKLGHSVSTLGIYEELELLYSTLKDLKPDIVFNLMEHFGGNMRLDTAVVGLFEMMGIPYTGCGAEGLMLCRSKVLSKEIFTYHDIPTPEFTLVNKIAKRTRFGEPGSNTITLPCIVKKANDDASEGIAQASFVGTRAALEKRVRFVHEKLNDDALVERFIAGRELYVSCIGNKDIEIFPIREMVFKNLKKPEMAFATYKTKWEDAYRKRAGVANVFASGIPKSVHRNIEDICKKVYIALKIDGYARIDLRLSPDNEIFVIEANANPYIARDGDLTISAKKAGYSFGALMEKIIDLGLCRA